MQKINNFFQGMIGLMLAALITTSCGETSIKYKDLPIRLISETEINSFQKSYGDSFNSLANAIEDESYYELKARDHIDQFYNFDDGRVMFKIGHESEQPFRYTADGLLSYLIGKNKDFPNDKGIAKEYWRKIEWNNLGITIEGEIAIVIGKVSMENNEITSHQNYTMVLKRNRDGIIKLIAHKITFPC